jgi:predicted nucleotidyltransferase
MRVVGIIAEFNPFHDGHNYIIEKAKEVCNADFVAVIMNGDFVQRGEPAVFDKYARTKAALDGGADLVFELPVRFGISSAGDFALGGVKALASLGFVTDLCFGSECGDLEPLEKIAEALLCESEDFRCSLNHALCTGLSYPYARAKALEETTQIDSDIINQPNNLLGMEYCLALKKIQSPLQPHTITRKGMGYHEIHSESAGFPSATSLRNEITAGAVPHLCLDDFSSAMGYALLSAEDLSSYKDISTDLADRISHNLSSYQNVSDLAEKCRTRAFTDGRIRRGLVQCLLHLHDTDTAMPYLRLLGLKKRASHLLSKVPDSLSVLSRLAVDSKKLTPDALNLLQKDIFASDLYRQTWCRKYTCHLLNEYQHSPIVSES